jgi:hypothetical protein
MTVLTTAVMLASCFEGSTRQLQKPNRNTTANYTATIEAPSLREGAGMTSNQSTDIIRLRRSNPL